MLKISFSLGCLLCFRPAAETRFSLSVSQHTSRVPQACPWTPNLAAHEARTLQVSPTLHDLPVGDPPDYDSEKIPAAVSMLDRSLSNGCAPPLCRPRRSGLRCSPADRELF